MPRHSCESRQVTATLSRVWDKFLERSITLFFETAEFSYNTYKSLGKPLHVQQNPFSHFDSGLGQHTSRPIFTGAQNDTCVYGCVGHSRHVLSHVLFQYKMTMMSSSVTGLGLQSRANPGECVCKQRNVAAKRKSAPLFVTIVI